MDPAPMRDNTTRMSSTPIEQMSLAPNAIMTYLAKAQPSSTFVVHLF
jgi:hypothetical protein